MTLEILLAKRLKITNIITCLIQTIFTFVIQTILPYYSTCTIKKLIKTSGSILAGMHFSSTILFGLLTIHCLIRGLLVPQDSSFSWV